MKSKTRMYVLDLGRMHMDRNFLVAQSVVATRTQPSRPTEFIEFPVSAYYLAHEDGGILFDAGCNPASMGPDGRWPQQFQDLFPWDGGEECQLPNRLTQLGVGPDDIRYVVLSHMHNDHAGCVEFFRKSRIIVHELELAAALRSFATREFSPYIWRDLDAMLHAELDWRLMGTGEGDLVLADGVRILNLGPGHAHGMLGLHVGLHAHRDVILASDAIYCAENYGPPARPSGVVHDFRGFLDTIERIRREARAHNAEVWFGHDLAQFATLRKSTEGFYE